MTARLAVLLGLAIQFSENELHCSRALFRCARGGSVYISCLKVVKVCLGPCFWNRSAAGSATPVLLVGVVQVICHLFVLSATSCFVTRFFSWELPDETNSPTLTSFFNDSPLPRTARPPVPLDASDRRGGAPYTDRELRSQQPSWRFSKSRIPEAFRRFAARARWCRRDPSESVLRSRCSSAAGTRHPGGR